MEYFIAGAALAVLISLFVLIQKVGSKVKNSDWGSKKTKKASLKDTGFKQCPLCSTPLRDGENLTSKVYRPMNVPDQRCTIFGCPYCYPREQPGVKRLCPVCKNHIPQDGYLVTRLFNNTKTKKHVTVIGCTVCLKTFKKDN